ncbi:hypothetical protein LIER_14677 [Lithospermum erythrorhizon]|uniref:Uncharacterized protein n=1 Tax=Lithospermum erythrorhizon TaxID=34254 RepID=A0AAV3Q000_LITER
MPISAQVISVSDAELRGLELPHDDPVVIAPVIANYAVERMLVDIGSFTDILYLSTYDKLGLPGNMLQPMTTLLTGFTGHSVYPKGIANLDFTLGLEDKKSTIRAQFTIVDIHDSAYNGLIKRPILTPLRAIVSPLHLKMKFPTAGGIGEACGNQKNARICYQMSVPPLGQASGKAKKRGRENHPEVLTMRGEVQEQNDNSPKERESLRKAVPHEEIVKVPFADGEPENMFRMGTMLEENHKEGLIRLIREYKDIFAWGLKDMPG